MKNGFKIWDTDTHCRPSLETTTPFMDEKMKAKLPELEKYKRENKRDVEGMIVGNHSFNFGGKINYGRFLGKAAKEEGLHRPPTKFMGTRHATKGAIDNNPDARVKDMDEEGIDVQLLIGGMTYARQLEDREIAIGLMRTYNRYLNDFCGKHPNRLKAVMPVFPGATAETVEEIRKWGKSPWAVGIYVQMMNDTPMDHPDMEPIWKAVDDHNLVVIYHSNYAGPPYFPGCNDLWGNAFLGRSAAHPWGAMRAIGSFIGSGAMDRYKQLRFGILESGCGWLPFWMRRLDDQVEYVGGVPELQKKIGEHMTGGRFYSSIEMSEGQDMIEMVAKFMGPDVLMYASDYPHFECRFPNSVDYFMNWTLKDDMRRKMLWDNPARFYGKV
jgi:predicted TIM-barrel fold metal-dependent hydrolase